MNKEKENFQQNWHDLVKATRPGNDSSLNSKEEQAPAAKHLAALLRQYADKVESQEWPLVFGYYEAKEGPFWHIEVILSRPWGG